MGATILRNIYYMKMQDQVEFDLEEEENEEEALDRRVSLLLAEMGIETEEENEDESNE